MLVNTSYIFKWGNLGASMNSVNNNVINNSIRICATTSSLSSPDWFICSILFAITVILLTHSNERLNYVEIIIYLVIQYIIPCCVCPLITKSIVKKIRIFIWFKRIPYCAGTTITILNMMRGIQNISRKYSNFDSSYVCAPISTYILQQFWSWWNRQCSGSLSIYFNIRMRNPKVFLYVNFVLCIFYTYLYS